MIKLMLIVTVKMRGLLINIIIKLQIQFRVNGRFVQNRSHRSTRTGGEHRSAERRVSEAVERASEPAGGGANQTGGGEKAPSPAGGGAS